MVSKKPRSAGGESLSSESLSSFFLFSGNNSFCEFVASSPSPSDRARFVGKGLGRFGLKEISKIKTENINRNMNRETGNICIGWKNEPW